MIKKKNSKKKPVGRPKKVPQWKTIGFFGKKGIKIDEFLSRL